MYVSSNVLIAQLFEDFGRFLDSATVLGSELIFFGDTHGPILVDVCVLEPSSKSILKYSNLVKCLHKRANLLNCYNLIEKHALIKKTTIPIITILVS